MAMVKRSTFKTARVSQSAYNGETSLCSKCGRVIMPKQIKIAETCPFCGEGGIQTPVEDEVVVAA